MSFRTTLMISVIGAGAKLGSRFLADGAHVRYRMTSRGRGAGANRAIIFRFRAINGRPRAQDQSHVSKGLGVCVVLFLVPTRMGSPRRLGYRPIVRFRRKDSRCRSPKLHNRESLGYAAPPGQNSDSTGGMHGGVKNFLTRYRLTPVVLFGIVPFTPTVGAFRA